MLEKNALTKELNVLRIMEGHCKLHHETHVPLEADRPNKTLDIELNYMKEIRRTYFQPKAEDYFYEQPPLPLNERVKDYEINDKTVKQKLD